MADNIDDEDPPSRRESHFAQQRSPHRSSLKSDRSSNPQPQPPSRPTSRPRLEDFDLDIKPHPDRADTETIPSPSSPAPNVPYSRSRASSSVKGETRTRAYSSRGRNRSTPDDAKRIEELLAPESWENPYELIAQPKRSQLDLTALPSMTASKPEPRMAKPPSRPASRVATELYTISHLIFFAIFGTLARLGLQALTSYPGAPVIFSELWANVAGTFIMGFLAEDRRMFAAEWGRRGSLVPEPFDMPAPELGAHKKRHGKVKKTIPLYIGLATGFCGSFTSFSSFIRDVFLALSNDLKTPINHPYPPGVAIPSSSTTVHRNAGYSFLALTGTIILTISTCYAALKLGAHFALLLDPIIPRLPFRLMRRFLDPAIVLLGWGCWIGAVLMTILPPAGRNAWRGQALFACVFAPLGCLARYYVSLYLNPIHPTFPLGTFSVNVFGTAVLGMAYDLQRVPLLASNIPAGSVLGCQVLQGIMDGFCGCLTTVSTWISELDSQKRRHAYVYGAASVGVGLSLLVIITGSVRWTVGWGQIACTV
ncbi:chromosome condensation protein-like protein [Setomelanomma holmii]|uniref:Chromosome condensation protein-like protein n=1 Tax=Setomelanomma holmii TaxID=210430 RepID=A0A9P4H031_9PLEO|nr:chromosome condensation protein-like protein [Setomelanomma holmii]